MSTPAEPRQTLTERINDCGERLCGEDKTIAPFHCWLLSLFVFLAAFGVGLGLVLSDTVGDEISHRAMAFLPCWILGVLICPIYVYCFASRYSDDDDWGCGFGDYDEGPGNIACMMTSTFMCIIIVGCFVGSAAAIAVGANPNSTYLGP